MKRPSKMGMAGGIRSKLRSVRVVMTLWNVGVLALVLVGFGIALRYTMQQHIAHDIDQGMARGAHGFQHFFANSPEGNEMPGWLRHRMRDNQQNNTPGPYPPAFLNTSGAPLWPNALPAIAAAPWDPKTFAQSLQGKERYSTILVRKTRLRVFSAPLIRDGDVKGVVQFTADLSVIPQTLAWLNYTLLTLIPVALLIAGIGGGFLTTRMLRPVRRLADAAERIEESNLSGRLPVTGTDEFAELAVTFNHTLDRLESAFRKLEESTEQQRRFTGDASHELRTPLTIIKANASLALSGERTPAQYRQAIAAINQAADRMNRLVQDLLLLARSDAGQFDVPLKPVLVKDVFEEAIEAAAHSDGRRARIDLDDEDLSVYGDYEMLVRLFTNLLANAARHTPQSGSIVASGMRSGERAVLSVIDTGEGIAPEHLAHLTERFYRVDAARSSAHGGTGLGLAICQTIVEKHHGEMAIESTLGEGTRVAVTLPAIRPPKASPASKSEPAVPAGA